MQDDELRAIQLADPLRLKRLHLTPLQYNVIAWIVSKGGGPIRSADLKEHFKMSIKTASTLLLGLKTMDYLDREEVSQKSGGVEYKYKIKRTILQAYHEAQAK